MIAKEGRVDVNGDAQANAARVHFDTVIESIVDYVYDFHTTSPNTLEKAKAALIDALGCAIEGLHESVELRRLVGPTWMSSVAENGFKLPGTRYQLEPLKAAFDLGAMIRYLDHNDAFPGAEWGHPSDNIGSIFVVAYLIDRERRASAIPTAHNDSHAPPPTIGTVLQAMIKAYEIQGCFQIRNAFNKVGLDHTILVKIASTATCSWLLGLDPHQALNAVSQAFADGHPLRIFRQWPNTGPRKGYAAGDACMRAVHLALIARTGQPGIPTALTQPRWGFYDALFHGKEFDLPRPFDTWVMDNVIFKVNTAEGHGLSAVEAAVIVAEQLKSKDLLLENIVNVHVRTQEAGKIIIDKPGTALQNAADRDHSMQFMVAATMVKGTFLETGDYQDHSVWVNDARVKSLMDKVTVEEDPQFTKDYHDPAVRSCANAIGVSFKDGTTIPDVTVQFPLGHPKRSETTEAVRQKAGRNLSLCLPPNKVASILETTQSASFLQMGVVDFADLLVPEPA